MQARSNALWTFVVTSIALLMVVLDNLVVTTALPVIKADLGASVEQLEWIVNAYTLTFAVLLLTGAALGDRFGRRRLFVIGLAIFTGASALAAMSTSMESLILARALQGAGGAIVGSDRRVGSIGVDGPGLVRRNAGGAASGDQLWDGMTLFDIFKVR